MTTHRIPLFPLGTVVTPGMVLPLHIFEPRYRMLIRMLAELPADERDFGIIAIRHGSEVGGRPPLHEVGTVVRLSEVEVLPDGRFNIIVIGVGRFRLRAVDHTLPYDQGDITEIGEEVGGPSADVERATRTVALKLQRYRAGLVKIGLLDEAETQDDLPDDPTALSYAVAAMTLLDVPTRQRLLEVPVTLDRLREESALLSSETKVIAGLSAIPATSRNLPFDAPVN